MSLVTKPEHENVHFSGLVKVGFFIAHPHLTIHRVDKIMFHISDISAHIARISC
jgi:hypothetical protein